MTEEQKHNLKSRLHTTEKWLKKVQESGCSDATTLQLYVIVSIDLLTAVRDLVGSDISGKPDSLDK